MVLFSLVTAFHFLEHVHPVAPVLEAMRAGAIFGYRGLVREIITRIKAEQFAGEEVHIVATGGYAKLLAAKLRTLL